MIDNQPIKSLFRLILKKMILSKKNETYVKMATFLPKPMSQYQGVT